MNRLNIEIGYLVLAICVSAFGLKACAQNESQNIPRSYVAYKTSVPIEIDGVPNEEAWNEAQWTDQFIDIEGDKIPTYSTQVKMLWDEQYFYIYARLEEPHIWADLTKRDTVIFYNNDFEVFVDPDGDSHNYYELELNALNTQWDLMLAKPYREPGNFIINDYDIVGLKTAVHIEGTLNNPKDKDEYWALEIAIPWSTYRTSYYQNNVPADQFYRVNFSRVNWNHSIENGVYSRKKGNDGNYLHEYNWVWSPQGVINMHEPEKWGYVYFSSKSQGEDFFEIPDEEQIKWELFRMHRAQRSYYGKHKKYAEKIEDLNLERPLQMNGMVLNVAIDVHSTGYNATVIHPTTKNRHIIKEDGDFLIRKN